ncbi:hypothetical protein SAMN04487895_101594 [Paenibacillus sophorae]|uniref:Uncharacterized protein n=1 Tax=Paenibacillus sophorae TaxID=1333845 RepID=A0A1H8GPA3_9BACL|nr:hypothetical protein [Paenibacillus sophorae]QWU14295.1 hypothetical protein KP014_20525 [Paenibacillus sophorae]SEN45806.1 hypothetical protein SAMN04487895_101594 [Paenibacillus sophorae]
MKIIKLIKGKYYNLTEGLSNLIKWLPVIWNDRDFDQAYLYRILHKKLSFMEKFFRSERTYSANAPEVAEEIMEAKELLYNIIDGSRVKKVDFKFDEFISFNNDKLNFNTDNENYKIWSEGMDRAEQQEAEDMKRAFEIISEKSQGWWD